MRKTIFLAFSALMLLSCGQGASSEAASSSAPDIGESYFSAYETAAKETAKKDAVGFDLQKGRFKISFDSKETDSILASGKKSIDLNPLNMNAKVSGLDSEDPSDLLMSFGLESEDGTLTKVKAEGFTSSFSLFTKATNFAPRGYLENKRFYGDLTNASFLWMILNLSGRSVLEDPSFSVPKQGYADLDEEAVQQVQEYLPVNTFLNDNIADTVKTLKDFYKDNSKDFVFSKEGEYQKITYRAPSFSSLIDVFLEKTEEIEASSRVDQDDINSYAEKIRDLAEIQNGDVSFLFNDAGLHQMSFDVIVTFNETKAKERFADAPFYPCDDMVFKADIVMLEGEDAEPLVLSNARKASYVAYDLDKLDKIFDKFRPKSESEENSQE